MSVHTYPTPRCKRAFRLTHVKLFDAISGVTKIQF